jgi:hypothetical protein
MRTKIKHLVPASLAVFAFLGLAGISTTATAGTWLNGNPQPFSARCQSDAANGSAQYAGHYCDTGTEGQVNVLVPQQNGSCFYMTDLTVYNNNPVANGGHEVEIEDGGSRAVPAAVVFVAPWEYPGAGISNQPMVAHQDWQTPIVFWKSLYADVHSPNNNVYVTVSGFYNKCP